MTSQMKDKSNHPFVSEIEKNNEKLNFLTQGQRERNPEMESGERKLFLFSI
jgi:hypothetical protein